MTKCVRPLVAWLVAILVISPGSFAFSSPLSEEAIREAYFLGQRRDESTARFLERYKQRIAPPENGPYIASVELLTPFALAVLRSSQQTAGYSAQAAEAEHREKEESVTITVEVLLTDSYDSLIARPTGGHSGSPIGYAFRSPNFWKDIQVQVIVDDQIVKPTYFGGEPNYACGERGCILTGATIKLELPASACSSDVATVQVTPRGWREVAVDFDLTRLR